MKVNDVKVWEAKTGNRACLTLPNLASSKCSCLAISPDNQTLAWGGHSANGSFYLIDMAAGKVHQGDGLAYPNSLKAISWSPNGKLLAIGITATGEGRRALVMGKHPHLATQRRVRLLVVA
jgi:WD40 repeat protein